MMRVIKVECYDNCPDTVEEIFAENKTIDELFHTYLDKYLTQQIIYEQKSDGSFELFSSENVSNRWKNQKTTNPFLMKGDYYHSEIEQGVNQEMAEAYEMGYRDCLSDLGLNKDR